MATWCFAEPWRLLGPIEATVGVLMLGWSTGILVAVIGAIYGQLFPSLRRQDGPTGTGDRQAR